MVRTGDVQNNIIAFYRVPARLLELGPRFVQLLVLVSQGRRFWPPEVVLGRFSRFLRFWEGLVI